MIGAREAQMAGAGTGRTTMLFVVILVVAAIALAAAAVRPPTGAFARHPVPTGPLPIKQAALDLPGPDGVSTVEVQIWFPALAGEKSRRRDRTTPLVIYLASWAGSRTGNSTLAADLASYGYVVAAIDDVAQEKSLPLDLERDRGAAFGAVDRAGDSAFRALAQQRLDRQAARVRAVLAGLGDEAQLSHSAVADLAGALELSSVGLLGYSFGGAGAAEAALADARIAAVVNLDGMFFGHAARTGLDLPYLLISTGSGVVPPAQLTSNDDVVRYQAEFLQEDIDVQQRETSKARASWLQIEAANHADLSDDLDAGYAGSLRGLWRSIRLRACIRESMTNAILLFFSAVLPPTGVNARVSAADSSCATWKRPISRVHGPAGGAAGALRSSFKDANGQHAPF